MTRTFIIAEAGVNHNGSIEMAKQLVNIAAEAGADAVKFQTFKTEQLVSRFAPKAEYQKITTDQHESQYEMLKKLELLEEMHQVLIDYCQKCNIQFLSSPFDLESVDLLTDKFHLPIIKIASGEITNAPLLYKIAQKRRKVILSTGMSTLGEIEQALSVLALGYLGIIERPTLQDFSRAYNSIEGQQALQENVTLLHCTSEYPTPYNEVNLKTLDTLNQAFHLPVGLSDHTRGIAIPIAAVARGAKVIEKHFTIDRNLPGPDHKASLEPHELAQMIQSIRAVEEALGSGKKVVTESEMKNRPIVRKSIVAAKDIQQNEEFTEENITIKRPGTGLSPMYYWELLGKKSDTSYSKDEVIR